MIPSSYMNVLIVDDEAPARARMRTLLGDIAGEFAHVIVGEAGDGSEALELIQQSPPDVVLLDVQMPGMNGLELATHLDKLAHPPAVVFVTAYDNHALEAFEVHALDYLVKPVRAAKLSDALKRVAQLRQASRPSTRMPIVAVSREATRRGRAFLSVHERGRVVLVPVADILYLKAEQKYVTIRTAQRQYLTEESLVTLEEEFTPRFVRIHRNALVARDALAGYERVEQVSDAEGMGEPHWEVMLRGIDERLPVSRRQWPIIKALLRG